MSRPVPSVRAVVLMGLGLVPMALAALHPALPWLTAGLDAGVLLLTALDFALAPRPDALRATRELPLTLSSGVWERVVLRLSSTSSQTARGEVRDEVSPGPELDGHRQPFTLDAAEPEQTLTYRLRAPTRGLVSFGDLHVRCWGPLGLCARQGRVAAQATAKVYPDLSLLSTEALALAAVALGPSARTVRRPGEGREFASLREYARGDDYRAIDWKASARRGRSMVRTHEPERHQPVWLLLDCGRQMAGMTGERRKLDHAVDAALALAQVSLDTGDEVGLVAFDREVKAYLAPDRGRAHLRALVEALYPLEASFDESAPGEAFDRALRRHHKRSLLVLFTDWADPDSAAALVKRTLALRPRHLPLVAAFRDTELDDAATSVPADVDAAYLRFAAARLKREHERTAAALRQGGAWVVRAPAAELCAAAVNSYLSLKARGAL